MMYPPLRSHWWMFMLVGQSNGVGIQLRQFLQYIRCVKLSSTTALYSVQFVGYTLDLPPMCHPLTIDLDSYSESRVDE